ncbi:MAG: ribose-phosphate diphosphokinase [Patescibacteria group bacterium]|nr:ribose-phosphate diphosphokinase [Patescibacteria group bacterium]
MRRSYFGKLKLVVSPSHERLGLEVAKVLKVKPVKIELENFPNGELKIRRLGDINGSDVCILSSLHARYDTIGELTRICGSVQNYSRRIFGIFPFVRDGKSDHQKRFGEVVAFENTAEAISSSGIDVATIFDQHTTQHPSIFDTRHHRLKTVHHIFLLRLLIEYAQKMRFDKIVPLDAGSLGRNNKAAILMNRINDQAYILKDRDGETREVKKLIIFGEIAGQNIISFEDMIQSGSTVVASSIDMKKAGAKSVSIFAVHPDFDAGTFDKLNPLLEDGIIDRLVVVDTLPIIGREKWHKNFIVLSPAEFLAKVITHIHLEKHMRGFFLGPS